METVTVLPRGASFRNIKFLFIGVQKNNGQVGDMGGDVACSVLHIGWAAFTYLFGAQGRFANLQQKKQLEVMSNIPVTELWLHASCCFPRSADFE